MSHYIEHQYLSCCFSVCVLTEAEVSSPLLTALETTKQTPLCENREVDKQTNKKKKKKENNEAGREDVFLNDITQS